MAKFDLAKFLQILAFVGPAVLVAVPGGAALAPLVPVIISAIGDAQAIKGATGAEKKAHVLKIATAAVTVANSTGKVRLSETEVEDVAGKGIDAVIGTIHIVQGAKVVQAAA